MGGAALVAIAIVIFVLLVSAQVFRDWPIAGLGDGREDAAAVSPAEPASGSAVSVVPSTRPDDAPARATRRQARPAGADSARSAGSVAEPSPVVVSGGGQEAPAPVGSTGGGQGASSEPAGSPQAPNPGAGSAAVPVGGAPGSAVGGGSGGDGGGSGGGAIDPAPTPSGQVAQTVNGTVAKVDETALGGTLGNSGVTAVTDGVVNGVAGPESTVGKVVDEVAGAVDGLLHGNR
jgi:hypothetical protein